MQNEEFLPTLGLELRTLRFIVRTCTDMHQRGWMKLSFLNDLYTKVLHIENSPFVRNRHCIYFHSVTDYAEKEINLLK